MSNFGVAVLSKDQYKSSTPNLPTHVYGSPDVITEPIDKVVPPGHFLDDLARLMEQIAGFLNVPRGLNGEDSESPTASAVNMAREVVLDFVRLGVLPTVMMVDDGGCWSKFGWVPRLHKLKPSQQRVLR